MESALAQLDLTADQEQKVRAIFDAHRASREDGRADRSAGPPTREQFERMEAEREELRKQLAAVLTSEQLAKLEQLMQREHPRHSPAGDRPPRR